MTSRSIRDRNPPELFQVWPAKAHWQSVEEGEHNNLSGREAWAT